MFLRPAATAAVVTALALALPAQAQWDIPSTRIEFPEGRTGTVIVGSLRGRNPDARDYVLDAKAGQVVAVSLQSASNALYFNVLPPASSGQALFTGETAGKSSWRGTLAADGDYTVRVYLNRAASRQGVSANYKLTVSTSVADAGAGGPPGGPSGSSGNPYDATGQLPCATGGMPAGAMQCGFGVKRTGPGKAVLDISAPDGTKRSLIFSGARVSAGPQATVAASRQGDGEDWSIDVNDYEHYSVPKSVIDGH